jgi:hypothetical protein
VEKKEKHIYAFFTDGIKTWELDLFYFGVREDWTSEQIWTVARREMKNIFGKPVDYWGVKR